MQQKNKFKNIHFYFQSPFSGWMPTSIFNGIYLYFKTKYIDIIHNETINYNNNCSSTDSPHHLIIKNIITKKYKVITYWDKAIDLLDDIHGWDNRNCLGIYSSVDSAINDKLIPISYCCFNENINTAINNCDHNFYSKNNNTLLFRGYLYGQRILSNTSNITITDQKLSYENYIKELNTYKIGLSLNGAAEVCNRDIEILGVGSVLLRPKFQTTKFYNELIDGIHYISYELSNDPKEQTMIIENKYNEIIKDQNYLSYIANNGYDWYRTNASKESNISLITKLINLEELL